ncbi:MAG: sialate O-acetylesterase, partial [Verrucomicrobiota bacterium]
TKEIWAKKQAEAEYPNIRLFKCDPLVVRTPTKEVKGGYMEQPNADVTRDRSYTQGWARCTPTLAGNYAGTGYYFAEKVHRETEVPIGLLWASIGSVGAECYISPEAIAASPTGQRCLAAWDAKIASGRRDKDNLLYPSSMYKTMLHACQKFPIKGALWYQGESNSHRGEEYRRTLNLLLQDWRARWGLGDFPFLMVQLPEIDFPRPKAKKSHWPDLRDSQVWSSKNENNVGLAVIIDTKEIDKTGRASLHPYNKYLPGHRLAQYAMGTVYGKNTPFRGPTFRAHRVEGSRIIVEFEPDSLGSGLVAADRIGQGVEINRTGVRIAHVDIAGADQNFVPAEATIEGDTLVVSSVNVASPVAVRYAWANNPAGANLYNQEGIPASPFRTDFWPLATEGSNHY